MVRRGFSNEVYLPKDQNEINNIHEDSGEWQIKGRNNLACSRDSNQARVAGTVLRRRG